MAEQIRRCDEHPRPADEEKTWEVVVDLRRCPRCRGGCRVTTEGPEYWSICLNFKCQKLRTGRLTKYFTTRACEGCAIVRRVTVTARPDGSTSARALCLGCKLLENAAQHDELAVKAREGAAAYFVEMGWDPKARKAASSDSPESRRQESTPDQS